MLGVIERWDMPIIDLITVHLTLRCIPKGHVVCLGTVEDGEMYSGPPGMPVSDRVCLAATCRSEGAKYWRIIHLNRLRIHAVGVKNPDI